MGDPGMHSHAAERASRASTSHRGTIVLEEASILAHDAHPGGQFVLRLEAPEIARRARPGSFVHLRCDPGLPMRRPMSLMRSSGSAVDILYKVHGRGTALLAGRLVGERLSVLGPIGRPFEVGDALRRPLLLGGGVGIPPMIFLAEHLRRRGDCAPLILLGSEIPFPFRPRPSAILLPGVPAGAIATMPLLEDWGLPCRLASRAGLPGCFDGLVTELAGQWLDSLDAAALAEVEVFACGPMPMLRATARLAQARGLRCQVSLEEYMACAVGGCAGCAVEITGPTGAAMKRVCVDGPVFDAATVVFPPEAA
jgi:dihydroorotate dehydrogenase electron transfer subunit